MPKELTEDLRLGPGLRAPSMPGKSRMLSAVEEIDPRRLKSPSKLLSRHDSAALCVTLSSLNVIESLLNVLLSIWSL